MPASSQRGATRVEDRGEGGANHANCVTTAHLARRNLARTLRPRIARGGVTRFLFAGLQNLAIASMPVPMRWV